MKCNALRTALLALACGLHGCTPGVVANPARATDDLRVATSVSNTKGEPTTYVQNEGGEETISVYANGGSTYLRSISNAVYGFALDTKGHIFVGGPEIQNEGYPLYIYAHKGAKLVQTIYQRHSFSEPIVDSNGNVFAICANARVCEYRAAEGKEVLRPHAGRKIQLNPRKYVGAGPIAIDPKGDLAIANPISVGVYPPGKTSPEWSVPLDGNLLSALAFDNAGNLYIAVSDQPAVIWEFAPGKGSPKRSIDNSAGGYVASLGFDQKNDLYALTVDKQTAAVSVYSSSSSEPFRVITDGLIAGEAEHLAVSASGELFVSNLTQSGSLVVYASGQDQPLRTVEVPFPSQIGLAP